jgi:glutamate 5-kinase
MTERAEIASARRWVVKVGSALLTDDGRGLDVDVISALVKQLAQLRESGCEVVLVSSGAVAAGIVRLSWDVRPQLIHELQAAAAVGQSALIQSYETAFKRYGVATRRCSCPRPLSECTPYPSDATKPGGGAHRQ